MTTRTAVIAFVLFILSVAGGCDSSTSMTAEEARRLIASNEALAKQFATLARRVCTNHCEAQYWSCIEGAIAMDMQNRIQVGATKGPSKISLPGCWPYPCADDEQKKAVSDPAPSCAKLRDSCLATCSS